MGRLPEALEHLRKRQRLIVALGRDVRSPLFLASSLRVFRFASWRANHGSKFELCGLTQDEPVREDIENIEMRIRLKALQARLAALDHVTAYALFSLLSLCLVLFFVIDSHIDRCAASRVA
jgi:hypothetical protein